MSQKRKSEDFRFGRIQESEICALDGGICWSLVGVCSFYCARRRGGGAAAATTLLRSLPAGGRE